LLVFISIPFLVLPQRIDRITVNRFTAKDYYSLLRHGIITPMDVLAIHTEELSKHFTTPRTWRQMLGGPRSGQKSLNNRTTVAVDQVSLEVRAGELYGLLGPNGAGKTTLIKLLSTMIVPSSGNGTIFGAKLHQSGQIREMVGMATGDERSFYWRLTGRHNLEFFGALCGLSESQARLRSTELLEQVGLTDKADRQFRTYSSGQKQRLSIARALLHRPRMLFLDEPTRSLDPTATFRLHEFIETELLKRHGMTILLTTHRLDEADRLSHRIGIMDKGRLRAQGTPDELRARLGPTVGFKIAVTGLTIDPAALGVGLPGPFQAEPMGEAGSWLLELQATNSDQALAACINRIVEAGGQIRDVQRELPSLDQVFQRFTEN
jgi:ABC-2 type transport system ATP-binding protein